ncbi:armadillo-type protein [Russula vinacea]|nr:armadillo-type protein [Russula vinacea]
MPKQPNLIILAVNTFVRDSDDQPLIRALAIRTMGCIRVEKINASRVHYRSVYLTKTHMFGRQQLPSRREYHICSIRYSQSATSQPSTPSSNPAIFTATPTILNTFLITLNECSEWDHVAIVSALARCHSPLKVIMILMRKVPRKDFNNKRIQKMAPSLVTLFSSSPRMETLDIMVRLPNENNVTTSLYASEVDVDFVRHSIKAIGQAAVKIEAGAERYVDVLLNLIATRVQLQTLIAVVKLFHYRPDSSQGLVQRVLNTAMKELDSPDVRDRAYIYWRLLSTDPGAANSVILVHRPPISLPPTTVAPALLNELIGEISSLASIYQKPAATFIGLGRIGVKSMQHKGAEQVVSRLNVGLADSAKTVLQTVAAGQAAETCWTSTTNRDRRSRRGSQPRKCCSTRRRRTSRWYIDDLVSIFGNTSLSPSGAPILLVAAHAIDALGGLGVPVVPPAMLVPSTASNQQEDLLGLI